MSENPEYKIAFSSMALDAKIPPGDPIWAKFNASFENLEVSAPLIAWMIDDGRPFTTWHSNNWRDSKNYICGQHIGLDFDTRGVNDLINDPFIQQYGAILYATPSSTPAAPRCRALFLLDKPIMQSGNYVRAATALLWLFGGTADRKCKDSARFFYGSVGSTPTQLNRVLPLAVVRRTIAQHEAWLAMQPKPKSANPDFKPTTPDAEEAAKLLNRLSPTRADDYDDWLKVGMALASLGTQGLSLWDQWSRKSAKHVEGECARKWKSIDPSGGVTFGTLIHYAMQDSPR